ncbi:hypothetical protein LJR290_006497 [Variovorax sp. LjRoot290]|uniref:hypothetical protein n=1 Tax=unclassified Variovorax TaxID=663243 RepID=UPI003ECFFADD
MNLIVPVNSVALTSMDRRALATTISIEARHQPVAGPLSELVVQAVEQWCADGLLQCLDAQGRGIRDTQHACRRR